MAARKKDWVLTKEAFERLLASLDADRELAGPKYENVRRKLIEFFEARGSNSPADHAVKRLTASPEGLMKANVFKISALTSTA